MREWQSLAHVKWECKYHVVIVPKYRKKALFGRIRRETKGKSAIHIHRQLQGVKKGFTGKHFGARGYCVSTVGMDEEMIRAYVRNQEELDRQGDLELT